MNDIEIHRHVRPFKVAIKALLTVHLPPLVAAMKSVEKMQNGYDLPDTVPPLHGKVLGVLVTQRVPIPHDKLISHITAYANTYSRIHPKDVEGIQAAVVIHSKMESVEGWLKNHPDTSRIPMVRGDSISPPLPEDQEINDLLQEAKTLGQVYDRDFIMLMIPERGWDA